ncbi:hypothetical protein JKF63_00746 [Porcisia hertigi]|uniref:Uncharacterized protein n=1 Tax=Porcisia hertigi TaxID=2761500 RepID=A0A836L1B9_9TRYP|nr:hypothetical protein JKF63_00746 [Porcisia hertigi]
MKRNGELSTSGQEIDATAETLANCEPKPAQEDSGVTRTGAAQPALLTPLQPRRGSTRWGTKRSLASQYALRQRRGGAAAAAAQQRSDTHKRFFLVFYQFFLIVCGLFMPTRLARWFLGWFSNLAGRPSYTYDPQMVVTPTVALLNHTLNTQFFVRHPFAVENRCAMHAPMLLQMRETAASSSSWVPGTAESPKVSCDANQSAPHPAISGWKIVLIPYVENTSAAPFPNKIPPDNQYQTRAQPRRTVSRPSPLFNNRTMGSFDRNCGMARKSTHSGRTRRYSLYGDWTTETSTIVDGVGHRSEGGCGTRKKTSRLERNLTDRANVVISSYTKGAPVGFAEWDLLAADTCGTLGPTHTSVGSSGKLDPYTSLNAIASPVWVSEDPLALAGAQSFMETHRAAVVNGENDAFSSSAEYALSRSDVRTGNFDSSIAGPGQIHVAKRRLFYQAVVFPPLNTDVSPLISASPHSSGDVSGSGSMSSFQCSTEGGRVRKSNCAAPVHASVPVSPSPCQSWIYLRYWMGSFLMCVVALVSWLLGEKQSRQATSVSSFRTGAPRANVASNKTSSNLMTTAMTTIYRRLPATPSLAADVSTLPGNGDIVLHPKGYSPLVTQRFFVPLPIPILFMYGGEKRVMFHADHWCAYIRHYQRPRDGISDVVEVQGGGHWFFAEKKYQKKVADRIAEFLAVEPTVSHGV